VHCGAGDVADDDGSLEADVSPDTPPDTEPPATLRDNLRTALALLREAGWTVADNVPLTVRFGTVRTWVLGL
jgi:hypothetical protein